MTRKPKADAAGAPTESTALALPTITRAQANDLLKARSIELFHEAKAKREAGIAEFEQTYGRADRIDQQLLEELHSLQTRFAAIAIRQTRGNGTYGEPKVSKFAVALGTMIGEITTALAQERALELFRPIDEHQYVGYGQNGSIGEKGLDESVLAGYQIVDKVKRVKQDTPVDKDTDDNEGGQVCLHENVEPFEDEPTRGECDHCGVEFILDVEGTPVAKAPEEEE